MEEAWKGKNRLPIWKRAEEASSQIRMDKAER
jgi:hypothetical protein